MICVFSTKPTVAESIDRQMFFSYEFALRPATWSWLQFISFLSLWTSVVLIFPETWNHESMLWTLASPWTLHWFWMLYFLYLKAKQANGMFYFFCIFRYKPSQSVTTSFGLHKSALIGDISSIIISDKQAHIPSSIELKQNVQKLLPCIALCSCTFEPTKKANAKRPLYTSRCIRSQFN